MQAAVVVVKGETMKLPSCYQPDFSHRDPAEEVNELFYKRWSPRSFKKTTIPEETLTTIFDAARWAPSCFNEQPWLFVTSSGEEDFDLFLDLLVEGNQLWAKNASLIGFVFARRDFRHNNKKNRWSSFDCGAAWMSLALQASMLGIYSHGMGGIKANDVYEKLNIKNYDSEVICGFALGFLDLPERIDTELAEREVPSARKTISQIWQHGRAE